MCPSRGIDHTYMTRKEGWSGSPKGNHAAISRTKGNGVQVKTTTAHYSSHGFETRPILAILSDHSLMC